MHKIIHPNFELDLSSYKISIVEENYWFSNRFFTKYSFPFTFEITDDLIEAFGDLLDDNAKFIETKFDVVYCFGDTMETAVFEIESQIDRKVTSTFRYGFDELPNFDKKLSELPLEVIDAATVANIYTHAASVIPQKYPAINYNYPQIFTDKYDITEPTWANFNCIINNYVSGSFLINEEISSLYVNRNIIQPLPYLLHVLIQGFADAGFELKGDILTNETIKKILIYTDKDYFILNGDIITILLENANYVLTGNPYNDAAVTRAFILKPNATYRITGKIAIFNAEATPIEPNQIISETYIFKNGGDRLATVSIDTDELEKSKTLDITFTTDASPNQTYYVNSSGDINILLQGQKIIDITITRILEGIAAEVIIYDDVDLKRSVPDVTFGELLSETRSLFNLDINPVGSDIYINFVENQIDYADSFNLTEKEILKPFKKFNKMDSFLMKFKEPSKKDMFSYDPVFQNKNGVQYNELNVNDLTEEININILPLPQKTKESITTGYAFDEGGESKIYFCLYDGLQNDLNLTIENDEISLNSVHKNYHKKWMSFRLNATNYQWIFKMFTEEVLQIKKKIFAYGRFHVVKRLEKTQISEDLFEVQIESETLE